ncbi:TetR family transcriptional regulator [Herbiconiux sp. CPCC 205763]|uniref:TetR family transcriptional regulator n=1 Tax=Herbiconiux aconitum TaxID=2970913 RepID=A0ABT2GRI3_9MICO|nr:TetR/AcrR family transcriptional regulator [Herbiconiux aconitum]MCS5718793.1 TetR family transcriptional regulator [Herbiconiux aconitum]
MTTRRADAPAAGDPDRRRAVLESAMETFARFGYRKTSMDDIATAAQISRPGLYFLFDSKPVLFREAVTHSLNRDLGLISTELGTHDRPLAERLIAAFDLWAGSYVGPLSEEVSVVVADPSLLGSAVHEGSARFEEFVAGAIAEVRPADGAARAKTLISASIGIKHQVATREEYLRRLEVAVGLLLA